MAGAKCARNKEGGKEFLYYNNDFLLRPMRDVRFFARLIAVLCTLSGAKLCQQKFCSVQRA